jgi:predicted dehydrogenase
VQNPPKHTLEIIGESGVIHFDNATSSAKVYQLNKSEVTDILPPAGFERNTLFLSEMTHFLHVAKGKEIPVCGIHDGIEALKLTLAVHESARTECMIKLD